MTDEVIDAIKANYPIDLYKAELLARKVDLCIKGGQLKEALDAAVQARDVLEKSGLVTVFRDSKGEYYAGPNGFIVEAKTQHALDLHVDVDVSIRALTSALNPELG
ncbi:MAG: hypothetical protein ACPGRX_04405 [Bdellovibrionales bacterium]